jgi:hypothetical protein
MTNEQAIRALVDVARQWAETGADGFSAYGQGYCGAMASVLATLGRCPAGAAAIRGETDPVAVRGKARNRPKSSRGIGQASRGLKTRGDGRVTGGDES